jgi:hypothetical protein
MKIRVSLVVLTAIILYTGTRAFAVEQVGDGTAAARSTFVGRVANKCPSTGKVGSVYCASSTNVTHIIRYIVPKCAAVVLPGFSDAPENLRWVALADQQATNDAFAAACAPPPAPGMPPCVPVMSAWSSPGVSGVQTAGVVSVSPLPCQVAAPLVTTRCAPRVAVVTPLPDPKFPGTATVLPQCAYTYGAFGMCTNGVRTRAITSTSAAMCAGVPDLCQACSAPDAYADCQAFPYDDKLDCDYRGVCTVSRVARDCSRFKP